MVIASGGGNGREPENARETISSDEFHCELDGPLSMRSGETVTHGLLLTNRGAREVTVDTAGDLIPRIIDPGSAAVVGGFTGVHRLPLIKFTAAPGETVRIPLLVGTTSFVTRLGDAIPPGRWLMVAPLNLTDGRKLVTPPLNLTVTG